MMNMLPEEAERSFSFTLRGARRLQGMSKALGERATDGGIIYHAMKEDIRFIPFCDYLKRYIYINSNMSGSFRDIPVAEYRRTLMALFRENGVPSSMQDRDIRMTTAATRWLEQRSVGRETVLLLGFGLSMVAGEVNAFLTEALHGHLLDPEDPLEALCLYCYQHRYGWDKLKQLRALYALGPDRLAERVREAQPAKRSESGRIIRQDLALLSALLERQGDTSMRRRTRECFRELYEKAGHQLQMESSGRLHRRVRASDLEQVLCPMVRRDVYGNLQLAVQADVRAELSTKRFTRLHQHLLLTGKKEPERYDLLTLGFLLHTGSELKELPAEQRVDRFRRDMNRILAECGYGPIYEADPYEVLLLLALSSAEPLEAYNTVIEMACERQEDAK